MALIASVVAAACGGQSKRDDQSDVAVAGKSGGRAGAGESGDRASAGESAGRASGGVTSRAGSKGESEGGAGLEAAGGSAMGLDAGAGGVSGAFGGQAVGGAGGEPAFAPVDINSDGCVDLHDWVILARDYGCSLSTCGDRRADITQDGWIDDFDYLALVAHWYEGERCRSVCTPAGTGGAGGAGGQGPVATDLNGDGCIGWDDVALLADSYGCDSSCAAPDTDVVPDNCVDDRDVDVWMAVHDTSDWCVENQSAR